EVLSALDLALLERMSDGRISLAAEPPAWFLHFASEASDMEETFPFLGSFLVEAEAFWQVSASRLDSDSWVQLDSERNEFPLQASAFRVGDRKFIVLRLLGAEYERRRTAV